MNISDTEYDNIYASRKVIKNADINKNPAHYYGYDLWKDINDQLKDNLIDGETVYGECVGFTKDGGAIQKGYDYGCKPGESKIYVYRITYTTISGKVIDVPFNLVQERCIQLGVESVPEIFFGKAKDLMTNYNPSGKWNSDEEFREALFQALKDNYVHDQDCQFCATKVPAEGIVLRLEGLKPEALKLKAFRFLEHETKELDKGEANIEDEQ